MSLVLDSSTICKDKQFRVAYNQNDEITSSRQRVDNVQVCRTMFESSNVLENLVRLKRLDKSTLKRKSSNIKEANEVSHQMRYF